MKFYCHNRDANPPHHKNVCIRTVTYIDTLNNTNLGSVEDNEGYGRIEEVHGIEAIGSSAKVM